MRIVYYIFLLPFSLLPFPVLYFFSGFWYFVIYHILGYRKEVVRKNLINSFPEKNLSEIKRITRSFYRHLTQLVVESIKVFTISKKQIDKRMISLNPEVVNELFDRGRSVILAGGHYGNWELFAVAIDDHVKHDTYAVYTPIKNKFLDKKMKETRGKYGLRMIPAREARRVFEKSKEEGSKPILMILATDQSPPNPKNAYWLEFLNQDTGVLFGTEKYACTFDIAVVYGAIKKLKRGHYSIEYKLITNDPMHTEYGEITRKHSIELEKTIREKPDFWLWSHKRWKKKRPADANIPK